MKTACWSFDFISPYAYLQSAVLERIATRVRLRYRPVLFAGLLNHHGQKGPAEIASKKVHTFRQVVWEAHRHGIPLNLPAAHPFNPLPMLRLSIALGNDPQVVQALFRFVWVEGHLPTDAAAWAALCRSLGVSDPETLIAQQQVKETLRINTEEAIAEGLFGVPSLRIDDEVFWGFDMTDAALAWLDGDPVFSSPLMQRALILPDGVQRPVR